jgi:hypothetical protein
MGTTSSSPAITSARSSTVNRSSLRRSEGFMSNETKTDEQIQRDVLAELK